MTPKTKDDVGEAEQERRRDDALRRALAMPPQPHKSDLEDPAARRKRDKSPKQDKGER